VYKKYGEMSQKLNILRRSVSDKSCKISEDLFTNTISLTLDGIAKVRSKLNQLF